MTLQLEEHVGALGCGLSFVAAIFAFVGLLPLLGWVNWITTLPVAALAIIFSAIGLSRNGRTVAALGLIGGVLVLSVALFRLALGGGIL